MKDHNQVERSFDNQLENFPLLVIMVDLKEVENLVLSIDPEVDIDSKACTQSGVDIYPEVCTVLGVDIDLEVCTILEVAPQAGNIVLQFDLQGVKNYPEVALQEVVDYLEVAPQAVTDFLEVEDLEYCQTS